MSEEKLDPTNELEVEEKIMEGVEDELLNSEDLNKKNYVKITPTFYLQYVKPEEPTPEGEDEKEIYKILNPKTGVVETRELTDDEKHQIVVKEIQDSKRKFNPIKFAVKTTGILEIPRKVGGVRRVKDKMVMTNITVNQFGSDYRKARKRKNKLANASRKANRKH